MNDFLTFDNMLTPTIIQAIFWVGLLGVAINGLSMIFGGSFFGGLVWLALGALLVRVWCELLIIAFRISDTLSEIRETLAAGNVSQA